MKLSPEQWGGIEHTVDDAAANERKANTASRTLYKKTRIPTEERSGYEPSDRLEKHLSSNEQFYTEEAENLLGADGSLERQFAKFRKDNLIAALRSNNTLEHEHQALVEEEINVLRQIDGAPTGDVLEVLDEIRSDESNVEKQMKELKEANPESWYGLNLRELKKYKKDLSTGRLVETEYVAQQAEDVSKHIRSGQPVFIYGHLGAGKTELAFHVSRKMLQDRQDLKQLAEEKFTHWLSEHPTATPDEQTKQQEEFLKSQSQAIIISGSKHTSLAELYGHQILSLRDIDPKESERKYEAFKAGVNDELEKWHKAHPAASEEEKDRQLSIITTGLQEKLAYEYRSGTVSDFYLGPIYEAMEQGRPVILDEVNAIPHEVLISLNHLLTRKPGDKIKVQQNSGKEITIKEGFGFILTGNINEGSEQYIGRQDLDPAFLSRLYKMEHQYLPQATEGTLDEAHLGTEQGQQNELFELLIARVMDRNGNVEIPGGDVRKLWNLAKAARVTQDVFAGTNIKEAFYFNQGSGSEPVNYRLKEGVLSIRGIDKVITAWQTDGYRNELDYYVFKEFVNQSTKVQDKAYLYQLFKDQFDFFQGPNWEQNPNYGTQGNVTNFSIPVPENKSSKAVFMDPREVINVVYGSASERTEFPILEENQQHIETASTIESEQNIELLTSLEEYQANLEIKMQGYKEYIDKVCST